MDPAQINAILGDIDPRLFWAIVLWTMVWKGFALWRAAQRSHKWWFIIILFANTFGILDIIYLYFVSRKYDVEMVETGEK